MVCLYIGGICLCKCTAGVEQGSPSFITVKALPAGETEKNCTILCFSQTDGRGEGGICPGIWFLGSTTAQCSFSLSLFGSLSHTHIHPASGWTLIWLWLETGAQRREGKGAHIYCGEAGNNRHRADLNVTQMSRAGVCFHSELNYETQKQHWQKKCKRRTVTEFCPLTSSVLPPALSGLLSCPSSPLPPSLAFSVSFSTPSHSVMPR